jgi:hypothetical protein
MDDERRAMYDGFSDTGKHGAEDLDHQGVLEVSFCWWPREVSCPYSKCENRRMLSEYEISAHLGKKGFMLNYLLWHKHGEVQHALADESNGNDDIDRMDDMVIDIGRGYDLESEDPPPKV